MDNDSKLKFLQAIGVDPDNKILCSIYNNPIMHPDYPLPQPCLSCGNEKYYVSCSLTTIIDGKYKYYCMKHKSSCHFLLIKMVVLLYHNVAKLCLQTRHNFVTL